MKLRVLGVIAILIVIAALIWHSYSRPSMTSATVALPAVTQVTAPPGYDDVLTIIYSGDGGWRDLDQQLGKLIVGRGLPVLGISALSYNWQNRTPEESAKEMDALIAQYLTTWHKKRVWLIGFSFGADVLPSIVERLSPANRALISQVVLLSPSRDVNFEVELEEYMRENWLKTHTKAIMEWLNPVPHYPALPRIEALNNQPPVICYYGRDDSDDSLCSMSGLPTWLKIHEMPGDHHFDYNYPGLVTRMINELPATTANSAEPLPH